jgi:hypothetical protein
MACRPVQPIAANHTLGFAQGYIRELKLKEIPKSREHEWNDCQEAKQQDNRRFA